MANGEGVPYWATPQPGDVSIAQMEAAGLVVPGGGYTPFGEAVVSQGGINATVVNAIQAYGAGQGAGLMMDAWMGLPPNQGVKLNTPAPPSIPWTGDGGEGVDAIAIPGIAVILAWLARVAPSVLAMAIKYWPVLASVAASLGITAATGALTGGNGNQNMIDGVPLGGPFAAEPPAAMIAKEWGGIGGSRFYLLVNGKLLVRKSNGVYRVVRRPRMLHMKIANPRLGDVVKANRIVKRTSKLVARRVH